MIKDNLKSIREAKGISATHISKALGYKTPQGYLHLESGQAKIDAEKLKVIAKVLGEDVAVFYDKKQTESVIKEIEGIGSDG